jgi:L-ribulokinase
MGFEERYTIGIDFGTLSARVVLFSIRDGSLVNSVAIPYQHGVIDETLPVDGNPPLEADWALQDPTDYLQALREGVSLILQKTGINPHSVIGLGIDFTSCTVLPTTADGTPLCCLENFRRHPHSWVKLWKHHAAQPEADHINELATRRKEPWLMRYGGKISAEWIFPKALQIFNEAPEIYEAASRFIEAGDWVVWQLTGHEVRSACSAGYKALWNRNTGYPSKEFCNALDPGFANFVEEKLSSKVLPPGEKVGGLTKYWATATGLPEGLAVAVPIIDAHAGALGIGIDEPGKLAMIMGTSTCHMFLSDKEEFVEGICGVVKDGIVPGYFGYEAGQAAVGDIFDWYLRNGVPDQYQKKARETGQDLHQYLENLASNLGPGESGLLALDWLNGVRSTLIDSNLTGLIIGITLGTRPEEIYRAFIEATAFGTKVIIQAFEEVGFAVKSLYAAGGLIKNRLLLQIYSDVTGRPIYVTSDELVSARGAAILGAVAGRAYPSITEAMRILAVKDFNIYQPISEHIAIYQTLFDEYKKLYNYFGRENPAMKTLKHLQKGVV